jgi:putative lipase involved disintegration of autophagic bodies
MVTVKGKFSLCVIIYDAMEAWCHGGIAPLCMDVIVQLSSY